MMKSPQFLIKHSFIALKSNFTAKVQIIEYQFHETIIDKILDGAKHKI